MQFPELNYNFPYSIAALSNNQSIAYTDEGSGSETLLFIHGLASYMPAWRKNVAVLKDSFRCITIDLPGYGKSTAGSHSGKIYFYADVLAGFISSLNLGRVTLVGHSMGGHVAQGLALKYPDLIKQLILLAPAGFETFTSQEAELLKRAFTAEGFVSADENQIRSGFAGNFHTIPADVEPMIQDRLSMRTWKNYQLHAEVVANSLYGMLDEPVFQKLPQITQRTLVVFGEDDALIPHPVLHTTLRTVDIANEGAVKLPDALLCFIPECGHFLQFEKPIETNELISDFLRG